MSTAFSSFGMNIMLRSLFTPDVSAPPAVIQFAACFSPPVSNALGSQLDEPPQPPDDVDVGYVRASVEMTSELWGTSDFGEIYNVEPLSMGTPTSYWGPLYGWALIDSDSDECLIVGELTDPIDPVVGQPLEVPVAALVIGIYG